MGEGEVREFPSSVVKTEHLSTSVLMRMELWMALPLLKLSSMMKNSSTWRTRVVMLHLSMERLSAPTGSSQIEHRVCFLM
jgi:hypothetical protein